jgi:hypothetical protein
MTTPAPATPTRRDARVIFETDRGKPEKETTVVVWIPRRRNRLRGLIAVRLENRFGALTDYLTPEQARTLGEWLIGASEKAKERARVPQTVAAGAVELSLIHWWKVETSEGERCIPTRMVEKEPAAEAFFEHLTSEDPSPSEACSVDVKILSWTMIKGWLVQVENATPSLYGRFQSKHEATQFVRENFVEPEQAEGATP